MTVHPYTRLFADQALAPTVSDDSSAGYEVGDVWMVTGGSTYDCRDATAGAAVWDERGAGGPGGAVDSVNGQTGAVVLDADDIDDTSTTHKFTTAAEITKLAGIATGATAYTDEMAQDAIGAMVAGTDTVDIIYTDATPEFKADVKKQMSITADASGLKLDGDSASPGNNKVYGTDGSGVKGWKADPSGSSLTLIRTVWNPLATPASPGAADSEFNGGSGGVPTGWSEHDPNTVLTVTEDATTKMLVLDQSTRTGDNVTGIYKSIPAGDFSIWTYVSLLALRVANADVGLALFEDGSNSSKALQTWMLRGGENIDPIKLYQFRWNTSVSFNSSVGNISIGNQTGLFLRIRRNSTTYAFDLSTDGIGWSRVFSNTLAFTPTHFGVVTQNGNSGATIRGVSRFFRYVASDVGMTGLMAGQLAGIYQ